MADRSLIFPAQEFRDRIARLQHQMGQDGIDALLLTSAADIFYVSGFLTRFWESPARPWYVIIPAGGNPVAVIPSIGQALMSRTWMPQIRTWDAPTPEDDGVSLLSQTLCDMLPETARIGVPKGLETQLRAPLGDFERVAKAITPRQFVDGTNAIQRVREIKSEAEVNKIKNACAIADRAFERVPEFAQSGTSLADVFRAFQMTLLEEGADWVSYVAGAASANGYEDVISPADTRPMAAGDVLMLDTGAVRDGYFCDFDRNYSIGPASAAVRKTQDAVWLATEHVLSNLRPGMLASDVHRMLVSEIANHGCTAGGGRLGHGLGVTLTEWPSFTPLDHTELRAGMVLTVEPGAIVEGDKILVHEENILLRDTGPELLSRRAPQAMPELS